MSTRTTLVLAILLIAALVVFSLASEDPTVSTGTVPSLLLDFQPEQVSAVEIATPRETLRVRRDERIPARWRTESEQGVWVRAASVEVETLLHDLKQLEPKMYYPAEDVTPEELEKDGLDPARPEGFQPVVTLTIDGAKRVVRFGKRSPDMNNVYVAVDDDGAVWIVPVAGLEAVQRVERGKLRERRLLELATSDLRTVRIARTGKRDVLLKQAGMGLWQLVEPFTGSAEPVAVENVLTAITSLQVRQFMADGHPDLDRFGLLEPRSTITLERLGSESSVVLKFGSRSETNDGSMFFMEEGEPSVYSCSRTLPDALDALDAEMLRDRNVMRLGYSRVDAITFAHSGTEWRLVKMLDKWRLDKPETVPADEDRVEEVLELFRGLAADAFQDGVDPASVSLDSVENAPGVLTIEGTDASGNRTLLLGAAVEEGAMAARLLPPPGSSETSPVVSIPCEFLDSLLAGWLHFRNREIWNLQLSDIRAIGRARDGRTEWFRRRGDGSAWEAEEGTEGAPSNEALTRAVARLLKVVAAAWEADDVTDLAAYGLEGDGTTCRIIVRLRRDDEETARTRSIVIGNGIEGTGAYYARFGEGDADHDIFVLSSHRDVGGGVVQAVLEAILARWTVAPDDE